MSYNIDKTLTDILERARDLILINGIKNITSDEIYKELNISKKTFCKYISNKADFVDKLLWFERENFKKIFDAHQFDGTNAIDILLIVSEEIDKNFKNINPSITLKLKKYYPEIYQNHLEKRINFIFEKIKINIEKGITQGIYRRDLSIELIARIYISWLIDIHNPNLFPPEEFTFETLFNVMFENLIRNISNQKGINYFEKKIKLINFKSQPFIMS